MRLQNFFILALFFIGLPNFATAQRTENWDCYMSDSNNLVWKSQSNYKRQAINKVKDMCKKESQNPMSCTIKQVQCESTFRGYSFAPLWQCTALDRQGHDFRGNKSGNRDTAALSAKGRCRFESAIPATCFMNMITCRNINQEF